MKNNIVDRITKEHENISKIAYALRALSTDIFDNKDVDIKMYEKVLDYIHVYIQKYHNGFEESESFSQMMIEGYGVDTSDNLKLINKEHDNGKEFVALLEENIKKYKNYNCEDYMMKIIAYSLVYADALESHMAKEDDILNKLSDKQISKGKKIEEEISIDKEEEEERQKCEAFADSVPNMW